MREVHARRPRPKGTVSKRHEAEASATFEKLVALVGDVENATLVDAPPSGDYTYELKYDGYRILAFKLGSDVSLLSRRRQDWTAAFPDVVTALAGIRAPKVVLDGELVALDGRGVPSFQRLQNRQGPLAYVAFDVLWRDGNDLRGLPIEERRNILGEVLGSPKPPLALSTAVGGNPRELVATACNAGFEGLVGKRVGSVYRPGRGLDWVKLKCELRQEFAIAGYLPYTGSQIGVVGSLILALRDGDKYVFAGKVGTGFDDKTRRELGRMLEGRHAPVPRAQGVPRFGGIGRWNELGLVAEVRFTEWTSSHNIRHPSFLGLRPDKRPEDCVREAPVPAGAAAPDKGSASKPVSSPATVAGVGITHGDRVLAPLPLSKLELARYYEAIGERMLPHVKGRPLTLVRWAEGKPPEKGGIYLRHAKAWGPQALRRVHIQEQKKIGEYLVVEDVAGLIALAQMDIVEIHTSNALADDFDHPNQIVFDLDPDPAVAWAAVVDAARSLRAVLREKGLESWVKTTGGKGLHVVVPLLPAQDWAACHRFSRTIAAGLAAGDPRHFVAAVPKARRVGKILIDYLRNNRGNTSVAAFSTRANSRATVSMPIAWDELSPRLRNDAFTVATVRDRLGKGRSDPWAGFWIARQTFASNRAG